MHLRSGKMVGSVEKRRRRRTLAAAIPDDLLISEVLVHLPAKSLARCRCVCRSWRAGIGSAAFVCRHLALSRARPPSSVLAIPREVDADDAEATSTEISFHRLPLPRPRRTTTEADLILEKAWPEGITRIISPTHCDGLVAIATTTDRVFVCNPATGEFVALPLGTHNAQLDRREIVAPPVALGFDRWRNSYVVARYFYRAYGRMFYDEVTGEWSRDYDIGHEVFTLGGGGSSSCWELTQDPPHAIGVQRPMCTRRAFYWHSDGPRPRLMRFGLQDRAFQVVPRPPTTAWSALDEMACLDDGKLCYVHAAAKAEFEVWMADENGPDELQWSLRCRVKHPDPVPNCYSNFMPVVAEEEDTMVAVVGEKLCRYNAKHGSMEKVVGMERDLQYGRPDGSKYKVPTTRDSMHCVVPYFESLVSLTECM
ncbi:unnamed protein product [Urochloa humidicola]